MELATGTTNPDVRGPTSSKIRRSRRLAAFDRYILVYFQSMIGCTHGLSEFFQVKTVSLAYVVFGEY